MTALRQRTLSVLTCLLLTCIGTAAADDTALARIAAQLAPGEWRELATRNTLADVYPQRTGHPAWGVIGPRAVVIAWNGGAVSDDALYLWGGGHTDYGGNEVYRFRFADLSWERLTEPSPYQQPGCNTICKTTDDTPTSAHSYDGIEWLPAQRQLWVGSGSGYRNGYAVHQAFLFDPTSRRWSPAPVKLTGWLHSDFDSKTGLLIVGSSRGGLAAYDPASQRYVAEAPRRWTLRDRAAALDQSSRRFVVLAGGDDPSWQVISYDLTGVNAPPQRSLIPPGRPVATRIADAQGHLSPGAPARMPRMGISYDSKRQRLVAWGGGPTVWSLDTKNWTWREHFSNGAAPSAADSQGKELTRGVYGRWRYLAEHDVFLGYNDPEGAPWLYRPK